nr:hypothetical protein [Tanacetum cinerariifolium]
ATGALWNLSFDDRNQEGIALAGGVEALALGFRCFDYEAYMVVANIHERRAHMFY